MERFSKTKYNNQMLKDLGFDPKEIRDGKKFKRELNKLKREKVIILSPALFEEGLKEGFIIQNDKTKRAILDYDKMVEFIRNKNVPRGTDKRCPICNELCPEDDMIDTEGMVNGGIGEVCEQCLEDNDIGR